MSFPQPLAQIAGGEAGFAGGVFEGVELGLELSSFGGELAELVFGGGGIRAAVGQEAGGRRGSALLEAMQVGDLLVELGEIGAEFAQGFAEPGDLQFFFPGGFAGGLGIGAGGRIFGRLGRCADDGDACATEGGEVVVGPDFLGFFGRRGGRRGRCGGIRGGGCGVLRRRRGRLLRGRGERGAEDEERKRGEAAGHAASWMLMIAGNGGKLMGS